MPSFWFHLATCCVQDRIVAGFRPLCLTVVLSNKSISATSTGNFLYVSYSVTKSRLFFSHENLATFCLPLSVCPHSCTIILRYSLFTSGFFLRFQSVVYIKSAFPRV